MFPWPSLVIRNVTLELAFPGQYMRFDRVPATPGSMAGVALNLYRPVLLDHGVIAATDRVRGSAANVLASAGSETRKEHQPFSLKAVGQG